MLSTLVNDPDGVAPATVVSVDMTGQASSARSSARIVDVRFPDGMKPGRRVAFQVVLNLYGQTSPLLLDGALDVPAGASATGMVNVYPASSAPSEEGDVPVDSGSSGDGRDTVAERVAAVEALPTNDQLLVQFIPDSMDPGTVSPTKGQVDLQAGSLDATLTVTGRYVTGSLQRRTGQHHRRRDPAPGRLRRRVHRERDDRRDGRGDERRHLRPASGAPPSRARSRRCRPRPTAWAAPPSRARSPGWPGTRRSRPTGRATHGPSRASASTRVSVAQAVKLSAASAGGRSGEAHRAGHAGQGRADGALRASHGRLLDRPSGRPGPAPPLPGRAAPRSPGPRRRARAPCAPSRRRRRPTSPGRASRSR